MTESEKELGARIAAAIRGWRAEVVAGLGAFGSAADSLSQRLELLQRSLAGPLATAGADPQSLLDLSAAYQRIAELLGAALAGLADAQSHLESRIERADRNFERLMLLLAEQRGQTSSDGAGVLADMLAGRDARIEELLEQIAERDVRYAHLRDEGNARLTEMEARFATQAALLQESEEALKAAMSTRAELEGRHAALAKAYGDAAARMAELQDARAMADARIAALQSALDDALSQAMPPELPAEIDALHAALEQRETAAAEARQFLLVRIDELTTALEIQSARLQEAGRKLADRSQAEAELAETRDLLAQRDEACEAERLRANALSEQVSALESAIEATRQNWDSERQAAASLRDALEREAATQRDSAAQHEEAARRADAEIASLNAQLAELRGSLAEAETERLSLRDSLSVAEARVEEAVSQVTRERDELRALVEASQAQAIKLAEEKRATEQESQAKLDAARVETEDVRAAAQKLADSLNIQSAALAECERERDDLRESRAQLLASEEELRSQLELALAEAEDYRRESSDQERLLAERDRNVAALHELVSQRDAALAECQALADARQIEVASLREQITVLQARLDEAQSARIEVDSALAAVRMELGARESTLLEVSRELELLRNRLQSTTNEAKDREDAFAVEVRKRESLEAEIDSLREEHANLLQHEASLRAELASHGESLSGILAEKEELSNRLTALESEVMSQRALALTIEQERDEARARLDEAEVKLQSLLSDVALAESTRQRLDESMAREAVVSEELAALKAHHDSARSTVTSLESRIGELEASLFETNETIVQLRAERDRLQHERDAAQHQIDALSATEMQAVETARLLDEAKQHAAGLAETVESLQRKLGTAREELQDSRESGAVLTQQIDELSQQITANKQLLEEARAEATERRGQLAVIGHREEALAAATDVPSEQQRKMDDLRAALQSATDREAALQGELAALRQELESAHGRMTTLSARLEVQEREAEQQTSRVADLEAETELLRTQLQETRGAGEGAVGALDQARAEMELLRQQIADNRSTLESMAQALNERDSLLSESTAAATEQQARVASLEALLAEAETQLLDARQSARSAADELAQLKTHLFDNEVELESALAKERESRAALEQHLQEARLEGDEQLNLLRGAVEAANAQAAKAQADAERERQQVERAEAAQGELSLRLEEVNVSLARLATELDATRQRCAEIEAQREESINERDALRAAFAEAQEREQAHQGELEALRSSLQTLEARASEAEAALDKARLAESESSSTLADHNAQREALAAQVAMLEADRDAARRALEDAQRTMAEESTNLQERLAELSAMLDAQEASLAEAARQNELWQNDRTELEAERQRLLAELASRPSAPAEPHPVQQPELDNRTERVSALIDALAGGEGYGAEQDSVAPEPAELKCLRDQVATLEAERMRLGTEVNRMRAELSEREGDLSDRNEAVVMAQNEAQALRTELRDTMIKLNTAQMEAREAMVRLNEEIAARGRAEDLAKDARTDAGRLRVGSAGFDSLVNDDEVARQKILISQARLGEGRHPLGTLLVDAGIISERQLDAVLDEQKRSPGRMLGTLLMDKEIASEEAVAQAIACQTKLPLVRPREETVEKGAIDLLRRDVCAWHVLIPLRMDAEKIVLAMANPLDETALNKVRDMTRREVVPVVATPSDILAAIEDAYGAF